jgi:hypothetical protein
VDSYKNCCGPCSIIDLNNVLFVWVVTIFGPPKDAIAKVPLSNGIYLFNVGMVQRLWICAVQIPWKRIAGSESDQCTRGVFTSLKLDLVFLYHNNRVRRKLCAHSLQESRPLVYVGVLQWWIQIKSNINPHVAKNEPKLVLVRCENASVSFT